MRTLVIESKRKGYNFRAALLAYVSADRLWPGGQADTKNHRPVWMMLAGTDNELRPFLANLQLGRKAELMNRHNRTDGRFEVLKSSGFQFSWQRTPIGSIVTGFLPELFRLDPGMVDPAGISFCIMPSKEWLVKDDSRCLNHLTSLGVSPELESLDLVMGVAPLFIASLDRRTRCPLIPDRRFYAQVLVAALDQGLASLSSRTPYYTRGEWGVHGFVYQDGVTAVGFAPPIAFNASHEKLETFLAEQVKVFHGATRPHG